MFFGKRKRAFFLSVLFIALFVVERTILRIREYRLFIDKKAAIGYNNLMANEIEKNIAENIKELRLSRKMKQSELGEMISYSDKTISKWENGSSVPDITALVAISEAFNVEVSDMVKEGAVKVAEKKNEERAKEEYDNDIAMLLLSVLSVFTLAVILYVVLTIVVGTSVWQVFVWSVPVAAFMIFKYNKAHECVKWLNALLLSAVVWGTIAAVYLQVISKWNLWQLFIIGVPLEAMVIVSTLFRKRRGSKKALDIFKPASEVSEERQVKTEQNRADKGR